MSGTEPFSLHYLRLELICPWFGLPAAGAESPSGRLLLLQPEPAGAAPPSKDDLVSLVAQHFAEQTVDEAQVIAHFLRAARRHAMGGRH